MRRKTTRRKPTTRRKTTTRRRRRISGIGGMDLGGIAMKAGGLIIGAVAARSMNTLLVKVGVNPNPKISALIQMGAGIALPMVMKGNKFVADVGDGMIANGGMVLAVNLGIINGIGGGNPSNISYRINGSSNARTLRAVNGVNTAQNLPAVSGVNTAQNLPAVSGVRRRTFGCM